MSAKVEKREIGNAILYCADCRDVAHLIPNVDHVITDPPYEAEAHAKTRKVKGGKATEVLDFEAMDEALRGDVARITVEKATGWALMFCQWQGVTLWTEVLEKVGAVCNFAPLVWVKPDAVPNFRGTGPSPGSENIALGWCGTGQTSWNGGGRSGVLTHKIREAKDDFNKHLTVKPQKLMVELVELFTSKGQTVLDLFMGSGSTGVAALKQGRKFVGIERNPEYFEVACRRIEEAQRGGLLNPGYVRTASRVTVPLLHATHGGGVAPLINVKTAPKAGKTTVGRKRTLAAPVIERKAATVPSGPIPAPAGRAKVVSAPFNAPPIVWKAPALSDLPSLKGIKRLSFDLETRDESLARGDGPGARDPDSYIVGLALGMDDGRRLYLPVRHEGDGNMDAAQVFKWARHELNSFDGELVGANLTYDLDFAANERITFAKVKVFHDVQIAEPLIDEWRMNYSLDALSKDYLGVGKDESSLNAAAASYGFKDVKANLWRLPAGHVGAYAEGDVDRPLRILEKQLPKIAADGLEDVYEVERKLIPLLLAMRRRGVRINVAKAEEARAKVASERDRWLERVRSLSSPKAELMAPDSFVAALRARGMHVPNTAKTDKPSVTAAFLNQHKSDELVSAILAGRKLNTLLNTFFDGHILGHMVKGRIHCEFNQLKGESEDGKRKQGTIARLSSSNPNLQNIPSREDDDITSLTGINIPTIIRTCFEPEDGHTWERLDESQVEYRLLAHRAIGPGAEECRQRYINDPKTDYHAMCAEFCGIPPDDKKRRKQVKQINFGKGYGARPRMLAILMNCSIEEATRFYHLYERKLPFTVSTFNALQELAKRQGYIETVLGRRQRFPLWEPADNWDRSLPGLPLELAKARYGGAIVRSRTYTALNRDLQGSGADVMKKGMVDAYEAGCFNVLGAPLLTVHDELDLDKPRTKTGEEAILEVKRCLEQPFKLRVPLVCDRDSGRNWGECS